MEYPVQGNPSLRYVGTLFGVVRIEGGEHEVWVEVEVELGVDCGDGGGMEVSVEVEAGVWLGGNKKLNAIIFTSLLKHSHSIPI